MEQYTLPMTNELEQLKLTVLDEDIASNDVVGSATIDLKDKNLLLSNDGMFWPVTVDLLHEGSKAGELVLAVRYHPAPTS